NEPRRLGPADFRQPQDDSSACTGGFRLASTQEEVAGVGFTGTGGPLQFKRRITQTLPLNFDPFQVTILRSEIREIVIRESLNGKKHTAHREQTRPGKGSY